MNLCGKLLSNPIVDHDFLSTTFRLTLTRFISRKIKERLDYSNYPKVDENDLEEQLIHGSGPGGRAVNSTNNCVLLKHLPSGVVVKCHEHREAHKNQLAARQLLLERLDEKINGEKSILAQIRRFEDEIDRKNSAKRAKLRELKKEFKAKQELEETSPQSS